MQPVRHTVAARPSSLTALIAAASTARAPMATPQLAEPTMILSRSG